MGRITLKKRRSAAQEAHWEDACQINHTKENISPSISSPTPSATPNSHAQSLLVRANHYEKEFRNERKKTGRLRKNIDTLVKKGEGLTMRILNHEEQAQDDKITTAELLERERIHAAHTLQEHITSTSQSLEMQRKAVLGLQREKTCVKIELEVEQRKNDDLTIVGEKKDKLLGKYRRENQALKAKCFQAPMIRKRAMEKVEKALARKDKLCAKGTYGPEARALARILVRSGCSQAKVGAMIREAGKIFGIQYVAEMSRRTVSRAILEGLVAAKMQLGYEMSATRSFTQSADSTSHRKINFESHHFALKVPHYHQSTGNTDTAPPTMMSKPKIRFAGLASTVDHSSETSKAIWLHTYKELIGTFMQSSLARRTGKQLNLGMFAQKLCGMNGDHAANEKKTAAYMGEWKKETITQDLGEEALHEKNFSEVLGVLQEWNHKKINDAGGVEAWNNLPAEERAILDLATVNSMVTSLGKEAFDSLPAVEKRALAVFLWSGCCMHKDQNSFKGGNMAMMAAWKELGLTPPIILANKYNAAAIRKVVTLEKGDAPITDAEIAALETSTFGGAKLAALAGAIFNNKDDKKGQGDIYLSHMRSKHGHNFSGFPQTSATRFGSHGEAAGELIVHLLDHLDILEIIRYKKGTSSFTNLELNIYKGLKDTSTLMELVVMALYQQSVTHPYMRMVRGPGVEELNALELGPLHTDIRDHCQKIIDDPELLLVSDSDEFYVDASFDGKPWERPEVVKACHDLVPKLQDVKTMLIKFFEGALTTWIRFSSEYAPGGLIDEATEEERDAAWMPATNDVNEGALGSYRVYMRRKPRTTLHQYNALVMFGHNETRRFMDRLFHSEDHKYVMKAARMLDASGLEKKRKLEQKEFDVKFTAMKREKAAEKERRAKEVLDHLTSVPLIDTVDEVRKQGMTIKKLDEQLDVLRKIWKDTKIPLKSHIPWKEDKQKALEEAFERHQILLMEIEDDMCLVLETEKDEETDIPIVEDFCGGEDEEDEDEDIDRSE
ncbi:uncharacterized protein ARMOST_19592 [Armillaria ostoyae]|uniref:Uncharacterized protein n=1 Tax=Armillaria ostoyae TaxID=47428 RepID=A0A284S544_ARMOS|nr:uncharacterized protein ARMOST_19592 [Armillaria ostoyae]